jgi:predicted Rossmann fold nucleotide-binding protein DprA/Smf involved in DNA uptake
MKTIGVVGSRRRATEQDRLLMVNAVFSIWEPGDRIISGGCPTGADRFAEDMARRMGMVIIIVHADWDKHKKSAGPIRNSVIAAECDVLIALPAEDRTGGTEDTIKKALKLGKEVVLV